METKDKARILIKPDGKKVIYIPSFELEIFEGDLKIMEKENRKLTKELKLMTRSRRLRRICIKTTR